MKLKLQYQLMIKAVQERGGVGGITNLETAELIHKYCEVPEAVIKTTNINGEIRYRVTTKSW